MAPAPASPPSRKRSPPPQREQTLQAHAAPVKRRRSSAADDPAGPQPQQQDRQDHDRQDQHRQDQQEPGAPQNELFQVEVRARDELRPSADVAADAQMLDALTRESADADGAWAREFSALDALRRFALHHPEEARRQLESDVLNRLVLPAASSLRSAMARNALLCVQDLVLSLPADAAAHFDDVLPALLGRATCEKQFLRDLARDVLDTALAAGTDEQFLRPLLATSTAEKNAQIVSVAGLYVTKCVIRMDHEHLRTFVLETRDSFFDEMAAFLNCKVVECKAATRRTCQHTRRVIGNEEFVALVKEKLSGSAQLDVLKASEIRKAAKPGHAKSSIRERMLQMKKQQQQQKKVQSGGNDVSVVVVAPPRSRAASSSAQPTQSS